MADDYRNQIRQLLPPGGAWRRGLDDIFIAALASAISAVDEAFTRLIHLSQPNQLDIDRWAKITGVPHECFAEDDLTNTERFTQATLVFYRRPTATRQAEHLEREMHALGFVVKIEQDSQPFKLIASYDRAAGQINYFRVNSPVNTRLVSGGVSRLECYLRAIVPAHIAITFKQSTN